MFIYFIRSENALAVLRSVISIGTIYRIVSNIVILASYRYRDNSPPNKMILRTTLVSHVVCNDSRWSLPTTSNWMKQPGAQRMATQRRCTWLGWLLHSGTKPPNVWIDTNCPASSVAEALSPIISERTPISLVLPVVTALVICSV